MNDTNYETILKRRRYRLIKERRRRRRKLIILYGAMFFVVLAVSVTVYGHFKGNRQDVVQAEPGIEDQPGEEGQKKSGSVITWVKSLFGGKEEMDVVSSSDPLSPEGTVSEGELTGEGDNSELILSSGEGDEGDGTDTELDLNTPGGRLADLLARAERLAAGYDYDGAIALISSNSEFASSEEAVAAIANYETIKTTLVEQDISQIPHVFFHSIIMDTAKAFDGDSDTKGYNQVMTTKSELDKILLELYNRGFVLVRLHDMAHEELDENGSAKMVKGSIMLPEGKKPIVMSQDDVCYYEYMDGDGFASRIIIGQDGKPTCEMKMDDGTVSVGAYDLVPILEEFINEHPDFSYKGARAVIAFTGYEGILGYRTAASYRDKNPNYEADRQQATAVAQCLRDNGWELASHSWGHRNLGTIDMEDFQADTNKWEAEVESLIGPTDIILYPFGGDIADWHSYGFDNQRYAYLYNVGFRYFCNVDSSQNWVQLGNTYLRQGRRNLDGYRMWQDIAAAQEGGSGKRRLDDLFRSEDVFDWSRPTPVEWN